MKVYSTHHSEYGTCSTQDFKDAKDGTNPSKMVSVLFSTFRHAVPVNTLLIEEEDEIQQTNTNTSCKICGCESEFAYCSEQCFLTEEQDAATLADQQEENKYQQ